MTPQRWELAVQEHDAILNALTRRDDIGLAHVLHAHLRHKRQETIQASFSEANEATATKFRPDSSQLQISSGL